MVTQDRRFYIEIRVVVARMHRYVLYVFGGLICTPNPCEKGDGRSCQEIQEPTDAIALITSSAICGSDLYLYEVLAPFMDKGDIIGHEPMRIVEEVGSAATHIEAGDRMVIPFNVPAATA